MFFHKLVLAALVGAAATVTAACSNDTKDDATTKHRAEAACEHINGLCASTEGFQASDCSGSQAEYEKLDTDAKLQADLIMPCVMAAKSCSPALDCVRQPSNAPSRSSAEEKKAKPANDTEDACEHINKVCAKEDGFTKQDCSSSNADYEKLSDADKEIADAIVPCIMGAKSCKTAFECLDFN